MLEETQNEKVEGEIKSYLEKGRENIGVEDFPDDKPKKIEKKKKMLIVAILGILALLVFAYVSYVKGHGSFSGENVKISIDAPEQTGSGDEISITVSCANNNRVSLNDAKLEMSFPDNFIMKSSDKTVDHSGSVYMWNIGSIPAQSTEKIRIYGRIVGKQGEQKTLKGVLRYRPSNFNLNFQSEGEKTVTISSVPVELKLNFPESVKDSAEGEFTFSCKNTGNRDFGKVRLEMEFPKDFSYVSAEPASNFKKEEGEGNTYMLEEEDFLKGAEKSVKIKGSFQSQNEKETIKVKAYLLEDNNEMIEYAGEEKNVKMEKTEILLSQTVNGVADYGAGKNEELTYKITFKNQSGKEMRGMAIKSTLSGNFDLASVEADKGTVKDNTITWSATNVPELASLLPQGEGSVEFKVKVKDIFTIQKESDKNFVLRNSAFISSFSSGTNSQGQENLIAKNEINTKVKAFIFLDTKGYFNDDGRINNTGSIPPQVGQKTYYTIHWSVRNFFNDVEGVRIASVLPEGIKWTGKYVNSQGKAIEDRITNDTVSQDGGNEKITEEKVFYDPKTNEVVWQMPSLKANEGVLSAAKEIVFQVEAVPLNKHAGSAMTLIEGTTVSAYDTFVIANITGTGGKVTTRLTDDFSISDTEAIVKP